MVSLDSSRITVGANRLCRFVAVALQLRGYQIKRDPP